MARRRKAAAEEAARSSPSTRAGRSLRIFTVSRPLPPTASAELTATEAAHRADWFYPRTNSHFTERRFPAAPRALARSSRSIRMARVLRLFTVLRYRALIPPALTRTATELTRTPGWLCRDAPCMGRL